MGGRGPGRIFLRADRVSAWRASGALPHDPVRVATNAGDRVLARCACGRHAAHGTRPRVPGGRDGDLYGYWDRNLSVAQPSRRGARLVRAPIIEVQSVSKAFWIPSVRRETLREHL